MKSRVFSGSATAMVAPYTKEGVDYACMAQLIDRQLEGGTAALVINGTTGEAATLSPQERRELLRVAVAHCGGRAPVIAGIGGNDTQAALNAAQYAEAVGADALLLTAPYYNKASPQGLFEHFTYVADRCGLPLIVYNVPGRTAVKCTAELYARLARHPRICGVKEASGDVSLVSRTRALCGDEFAVWSGNDDQTLPIMALGGLGVISVASNLIPEAMAALCGHMLENDLPAARVIHEKYAELFSLLFCEVNPIPAKTAMHSMGLMPLEFRLPLCGMEEAHLTALETCMRRLKLLPG